MAPQKLSLLQCMHQQRISYIFVYITRSDLITLRSLFRRGMSKTRPRAYSCTCRLQGTGGEASAGSEQSSLGKRAKCCSAFSAVGSAALTVRLLQMCLVGISCSRGTVGGSWQLRQTLPGFC